jgi:hypothetical protein
MPMQAYAGNQNFVKKKKKGESKIHVHGTLEI